MERKVCCCDIVEMMTELIYENDTTGQ